MRPTALTLLVLALLGPSPAQRLKAEWSPEGCDLAIWDVFLLPAEGEGAGAPLGPDQALTLFGYQVDRKGQAHHPVHVVQEIPYDLALRVPLGRVRKGQSFKTKIRYELIADHRPVDVAIAGKITDTDADTFRLEAEFAGAPAPIYDPAVHGPRNWIFRVSGRLETTFDCARGVMASSTVRLEADLEHCKDPNREEIPEPRRESHNFRFRFRQTREIDTSGRADPYGLEAEVGRAIRKGTDWLRSQINEKGTYGDYDMHRIYPHGQTCIATLTLLVCGAPREDPLILGLMEKIRAFDPVTTYEIALALMAMEAYHAPPEEVDDVHAGRSTAPRFRDLDPKDRQWVQRLVDRLISLANRQPDGWGWSYTRDNTYVDLSNTQYAGLGLLAAWRCGAKIPHEVWIELGRGVLRHQHGDQPILLRLERIKQIGRKGTVTGRKTKVRGFSYTPGERNPRGSMTCGGLSTLRIVRDVLRNEGKPTLPGGLDRRLDEAIEEGWAWMAVNWAIQRQSPQMGRLWHLYYLYSVERAGILDRVRTVNGHDWYHEGAAWLVETQFPDGHWQDLRSHIHHTCFALLFLKRATIPIPEPTGSAR